MSTKIDLDGKRFNVPHTDAAGVVNHETIFAFRQRGGAVTAQYSGGNILHGFLVGVLDGAVLTFRFCQMQTDARLDSGASTGQIEFTDDGRLRIIEEFEWQSRPGERGVNVFKELPA